MALPNNTKAELFKATVDFETDTLRVALVSDNTSYTFDPDSHDFVSDVLDGGTTAEEFAGTGYNRQTLSNVSVTIDDTDDEGVFDADDTTFTSLDGDAIQAIIVYQQVGGDDTTPGDDPILVVLDEDSAGSVADLPLITNGGDVTIQWDAEGIINIS